MILVNGKPSQAVPGATVSALLERMAITPTARGVAVAIDGEVVPRSSWDVRLVDDGSRVEVLTAMQGG